MLNFDKKTYNAYIQCMGGSGIIRAKDSKAMQDTIKLLDSSKDMLGIEDIYKRDMLDKLHVGKDIEYIIEAKVGYHFKEGQSDCVIRDLKEAGYVHATHGYSPLKPNYSCLFFAMGDNIARGKDIGKMSVVDIAPTIARIMGIDDFECDGKVLDDIFLDAH